MPPETPEESFTVLIFATKTCIGWYQLTGLWKIVFVVVGSSVKSAKVCTMWNFSSIRYLLKPSIAISFALDACIYFSSALYESTKSRSSINRKLLHRAGRATPIQPWLDNVYSQHGLAQQELYCSPTATTSASCICTVYNHLIFKCYIVCVHSNNN